MDFSSRFSTKISGGTARRLRHELGPWKVIAGLVLVGLVAGCTQAQDLVDSPPSVQDDVFFLQVAEDGVYAVSFDDLRAVVPSLGPRPSQGIALGLRGEPVPVWVADGGDGEFGPGDHLEFLGRRLEGERTHYHEQTHLNAYRLALAAAEAGPRMIAATAAPSPEGPRQWRGLAVDAHLERDRLRLRFPSGDESPPIWYWQRLTHLDRPPFRLDLDLRDFDRAVGEPLRLEVAFRGWSNPRRSDGDPADHRVEAMLGETVVGVVEWNGQEAQRLEIEVPVEQVPNGRVGLRLVIPKRRPTPEAPPKIDVVMLDWIRLAYPRKTRLDTAQERFRIEVTEGAPIPFATEPGRHLVLYGESGIRVDRSAMTRVAGERVDLHLVDPPAAASEMLAVLDDQWLAPEAITAAHADDLLDTARQADYVMLVHPRLREAIEPLAEFHRDRGLAVAVVEIDAVYQQFNYGIAEAEAIRDFLAHAYHRWTAPTPRFVLLVGDASWDTRNEEADDALYADWTYRPGEKRRFVKNTSTDYGALPDDLPHRDLIPTLSYETSQGHAASDNRFVAVDGDDLLPDMAIGRLPVTEPEEVAAIVAKIRRYAAETEVGPWRRDVLWITNEERSYQTRSDRISQELALRGFTASKVYPSSEEASNEQHRETLRQAFDAGQLLVHFYGHGGRYIWRTGPPDLEKNHDLFTLDDLDALTPSKRLPVVLSMSCYSAPFDHPTADSIGEKFLRLGDRGAVAVFAASWRNNPSVKFSRMLVDELLAGGPIGEAILRAKRRVANTTMVEMYNLLGDPAIELSLPAREVELAVRSQEKSEEQRVEARWPDPIEGQALVEWMTARGEVVAEQTLEVGGVTLEFERPPLAEGARWIRFYAWDEERQRDQLGSLPLPTTMPTQTPAEESP